MALPTHENNAPPASASELEAIHRREYENRPSNRNVREDGLVCTFYASDVPDDPEAKAAQDIERVQSIGASLHTTPTTATEDYGRRPKCFSSTIQEALFVLTTTLAVAQSSIMIGLTGVITSHIANDLHMTQAQVTWITAANS